MRQFLYLDTNLVDSIIAQQGKGLIDSITTEKENGTEKKHTQGINVEGSGEGGVKVWKLADAEAKLSIVGSIDGSSSTSDATREIIAKTLHDAAFDMAYEAIHPIDIQLGNEDADPGTYIEMKRVFDFIDFDYLEKLFSKDGIVKFLEKEEKDKINNTMSKYKESNLNREQKRHNVGKNIDKKTADLLKQCDQKYKNSQELISALGKIIPFNRMLVSYDGYLIPVEDKYFRINPTTLGFMYGGEIKCVGMITNIIGRDTNPNDESNVFATLQFSVTEFLRQILPTKEDNLYVVSPIAIYYEDK